MTKALFHLLLMPLLQDHHQFHLNSKLINPYPYHKTTHHKDYQCSHIMPHLNHHTHLSHFLHIQPYLLICTGSDNMIIRDYKSIYIKSIGNSDFSSPMSFNQTFKLHNILHVPTITKNATSVSKFFFYNNIFFEFHLTHYCVKDQVKGPVILQG